MQAGKGGEGGRREGGRGTGDGRGTGEGGRREREGGRGKGKEGEGGERRCNLKPVSVGVCGQPILK